MSESEDSATGEVYEVEWIEKKRIDDKGVEEYFIKWRNYPESENTWEPEMNLECRELLDEFEQRCKTDPTLVIDMRKKKKREKKDDAVGKTAATASKAATPRAGGRQGRRQPNSTRRSNGRTTNKVNQSVASGEKPGEKSGFDEGLTPESVIGATNASGELQYLVKWKERDLPSLVKATIANEKCPQLVLGHLMPKVTFTNDDSED